MINVWYHLNLLHIIVVYHKMQNKKILMGSSRENEFGDKNNVETCLYWAQNWLWKFFQPTDHNYQLDIMSACSNMQNHRNLMIQSETSFWEDSYALLGPARTTVGSQVTSFVCLSVCSCVCDAYKNNHKLFEVGGCQGWVNIRKVYGKCQSDV